MIGQKQEIGDNSIGYQALGDIHIKTEFIQEKLSTIIAEVLNVITDVVISKFYKKEKIDLKPYNIENKIIKNNLVKYKSIIYNYGEYKLVLDNSLDALNIESTDKKDKFLSSVTRMYEEVVGDIKREKYDINTDDELVASENGDEIIDIIKNNLLLDYTNSKNKDVNIYQEDLELTIIILISSIFIDCKILVKP